MFRSFIFLLKECSYCTASLGSFILLFGRSFWITEENYVLFRFAKLGGKKKTKLVSN